MQEKQNGPRAVVIWLVEFIQNLPLVAAFLYGYASFSAGGIAPAVIWVLAGVTAGALLIRYTEPLIEPGPIETPAETATNVAFFGLAIMGFIYYFSWKLGSWAIDIALSVAAGLTLGVFQARAAGERPSPRHAAALSLAFTASVFLIRLWALEAHPLAATVMLTAAATTIIVLIDYTRVKG